MPIYALDGPDGAGKSSIIAQTAEKLKEQGYEVHVFRNPDVDVFGASIRNIILNPTLPVNELTQTLLLTAQRLQLQDAFERILIKNMKAVILVDRWALSNLIYQSVAARYISGRNYEEVETIRNKIKEVITTVTCTSDVASKVYTYIVTADEDKLAFRRPLNLAERFEGADNAFKSSIHTAFEKEIEMLNAGVIGYQPLDSSVITIYGYFRNNVLEDLERNVNDFVRTIVNDVN